ncbi:hypothetical protein F0562_032341 [Nyssa sinensis]|uniref:Uncharacterized protein n=1 Tax=Nyssa sinensis TaxID=561372 RepID=A0A5J5AQ35_9ASTE|nr:hypothetical protein F0562_032341 [Nyssa sinensis]
MSKFANSYEGEAPIEFGDDKEDKSNPQPRLVGLPREDNIDLSNLNKPLAFRLGVPLNVLLDLKDDGLFSNEYSDSYVKRVVDDIGRDISISDVSGLHPASSIRGEDEKTSGSLQRVNSKPITGGL